MARSAIYLIVLLLTVSCASKEKKAQDLLETSEKNLAHLQTYRELKCRIQVTLAQPTKSAWLNMLASQQKMTAGTAAQTFVALESAEFNWRATPYRCQVTAPRVELKNVASQEVFNDTERKLETTLCLWLQSFYSDSPLRGWKKGGSQLTALDDAVLLSQQEKRGLEVSKNGTQIKALLGEGNHLRAEYGLVGQYLYPQVIEYKKGNEVNRVDQFIYTSIVGREFPESFWINLATIDGSPSAYMKVNTQDCSWR